MSSRWALVLVATVLLALLGLSFIYPDPMVSPGPLTKGHAALATDCFACHTPWRGATDAQCISCHVLEDIGIRTTAGTPVAAKTIKASFHTQLLEQQCLACHSAHQGARLPLAGHDAFSHGLLRPAVREKCAECHVAPDDKTHRDIKPQCNQCHKQEHWTPASFEHALLSAQALTACEGCHQGPKDTLHARIARGCHQCHDPQHWAPARFDHDQRFKLDEPHNAECSTCHLNDDYGRYTCYGCHEHTQSNMRAEHREEGVRFSDDCVKCHKSADDDGEKGGAGEGGEGDD